MTQGQESGRLPLTHIVSRVALGTLVVSLTIAAAALAGGSGVHLALAAGRSAWDAVKSWAVPW